MIQNNVYPFFTCLALTMLVFVIHLLPINNTMINYKPQGEENSFQIEDEFIDWAVDYHATNIEFKKRQVTTVLVKFVSKTFKIRLSEAFSIVSFTFWLLSGLMIYYLALLYNLSKNEAIVSVVLFYLSFSVLLAYFIPIATYDEPIQYFFILSSLFFLKRKKFILFMVLMSVAVIVRETTLLLFPALFFFVLNDLKTIFKKRKKLMFSIIYLGLPIILYVVYIYWFYNQNQAIIAESNNILSEKFTIYKRNFRNVNLSMQSILSFFSVTLLPLFIIYNRRNLILDSLRKAWSLTFVVNSIIIFTAVYAEESRVFYLPFLLILPLLGKPLKSMICMRKQDIYAILKPYNLLAIVLSGIASWYLFTKIYALTDLNMSQNLYIEYNTITITFIVIVLLNQRNKKKLTLG